MEGPELGNVPFILFFFSVRWESLVMEKDSPLLTSHTGPHHPHDLSLGVMAGLPAKPPLHRASLSFQEEEALAVHAEICPTFRRRRVEPWDGFAGILLDGTFALFFLTH